MPTCAKCLEYNFVPPLEAWDPDPDRLCLLHSELKDKDHNGEFSALVEEKKNREDFNFAGVFFPGNVSFSGFEFTQNSSFKRAIFSKKAFFEETTFSGKADFERATFLDKANFSNAWFSNDSNFFRANFKESVHFWGVTFSQLANYHRVIFSGKTYFKVVRFLGEAYFWKIKLTEKSIVIFQEINLITHRDSHEKHIYQPFRGNFEGLEQESGAILIFRDCNLSQVQFLSADVSRMEFDRVIWPIFQNRIVLCDELRLRQDFKKIDPLLKNSTDYKMKRCEIVERFYRQLKSNYEAKKDYKRVGDFHYGEMEMHRVGSFWRRRFLFSWYNFYWALNGYGERPLRAFIWFGVLLLAFTGVLYRLGLNVPSGNPASFSETFRFVVDKATLQRPDWAEPVTELGYWLATAAVLILPGQLALFLLALRNRLGRRR